MSNNATKTVVAELQIDRYRACDRIFAWCGDNENFHERFGVLLRSETFTGIDSQRTVWKQHFIYGI